MSFSTSFSTLELSVSDDHVAKLQFSRPNEYNTMNRAFWQELPLALEAINQANDIRAVIIASTGKHFSAGMDLDIFSNPDPRMFSGEPARRGEFVRRFVLDLQKIFTQIERLRMPVLAAIQGGCIGGAVDLSCATDSRYCTSDAFFSIKETELGMTADLGTLQRLPKLISPGLARELAYTSRRLTAEEALACGFVNRVFSDYDSMLSGVMDIAKQIAKQSPMAVSGSKTMLNYARDHSVADSLDYMATWQAGMFQPTDIMENFTARAQEREPQFKPLRGFRAPFQKKKK